jgi:hypothetical protein
MMRDREIRKWIVVGLLMFGLTACPASDEFFLEITGDESCIGATVVVDSQVVGEMEHVPGFNALPASAHFGVRLRNGSHQIELRKDGFASSSQHIDVPTDSEHYLVFEMKRLDGRPGSRE